MVQHDPGPARAAAPAAAPGHGPAGRARGPGAAVPDGADPPGSGHRPLHRHPGRGARRLPAVAAHPAVPGAPAGEGAEHPGADLLQVRGRVAGRVAQAEHRRPAGVLQRGRGHQAAHHRDRRRAVGQRAVLRLRAVRHRLRDLDGPRLLRPEAVPAHDDGDLGRHRARQPVPGHQGGRGHTRRPPGLDGQPGHRDQRGGRGGRRQRRHPVRAGQRAQPRADAPDRDRRGGAQAVRRGRRDRRPTSSSAAPAAARTSPGCSSRSCGRSWPGGATR